MQRVKDIMGFSSVDNKKRTDPPRIYGLIENPQKNTNLGPFLRCACAFGVDVVVAIGYDKCSVEGSHGAAKHVHIIAFATHAQAAAFLRNDLNCSAIFGLLGPLPGGEQPCSLVTLNDKSSSSLVTFSTKGAVEPTARFTSLPLRMLDIPRTGNIAVAFSKHQRGLPLPMAEVCDVLVHVPHYLHLDREHEGLPIRPLLDDVACFSIVLHQLTQRSGYNEHSFEGHKYDVALDGRQRQQEDVAGQRRAERAQRDKETQEVWSDDVPLGQGLLGNEHGDY